MPGTERDSVQSLRVNGEPLHLDLDLHVFRDSDDCVCIRGALTKRIPVSQPLLGVLVVGAVPVCNEVQDRHDDAIGNSPPQVYREPLVGLHHPMGYVAMAQPFQRIEVDGAGNDLGH